MLSDPHNSLVLGQGENGIAVKLDTAGNKALISSTVEVLGKVEPYSISGSLPLVRYLQDNGFDVQLCGYGLSSRYDPMTKNLCPMRLLNNR